MPDTQRLKEKAAEARQGIGEFARTAQTAVQDSLGQVRERSRTYTDGALDQYGRGQTYVVERIQDKPVTSVLAVLGVGVVLGVLLGLTSQRARYD